MSVETSCLLYFMIIYSYTDSLWILDVCRILECGPSSVKFRSLHNINLTKQTLNKNTFMHINFHVSVTILEFFFLILLYIMFLIFSCSYFIVSHPFTFFYDFTCFFFFIIIFFFFLCWIYLRLCIVQCIGC